MIWLRAFRSGALSIAALLAIVAMLPVILAPLPPLHDYGFHVARAQILRDIAFGGGMAEFYRSHTFLIPNVGYDLVCLALGIVFDAETTSRLVLVLGAFCAILGVYLLAARALLDPVVPALLAAVVVVNSTFLFGFMNYILGASLMPLFAYLYLLAEGKSVPLRCAVGAALSALLFWCHIAAFASFGLFLGGYELVRLVQGGRAGLLSRAVRQGTVLVAAALPALLILASPTGQSSRSFAYGDAHSVSGAILYKFSVLQQFLSTRIGWIDAVLAAGLVTGAALWAWRGKHRQSLTFLGLLVLFAAAFVAAPHGLLGGMYLDWRLPLPFALLLLGFLQVGFRSAGARRVVVGLLAALLVVRSAGLALAWHDMRRISTAMQDGLAALPRGSLVLTAISDRYIDRSLDERWRPPLRHLAPIGALNGLFVPQTWAHPTQQPIAVREKYAGLSELQGFNPVKLQSAADLHRLAGEGASRWRAAGAAGDVYLLLLFPAAIPALDARPLVPVLQHPRFTLYQVPPRAG